MHLEILTPAQITVLEGLTRLAATDFSLAGGTALALRHGHRPSIDFDFFRAEAFDGLALRTAVGTKAYFTAEARRLLATGLAS
jgi:hypothetical protein